MKNVKVLKLKSPFLTIEEAAIYLRLEPENMKQMRMKGTGPLYRKHVGKVVYHIDDLEQWSADHAYVSTGGTGQ